MASLGASHPNEGRLAIVTNVAVRCGGRGRAFDERRGLRTAKSCGPDAPTLASSCAEFIRGATVANKPGHRGEREGNRNTIAQGKPDDPVEPVVLPPCFFCTGPMGAIGTRLSLRPLFREGAKYSVKLGRIAPRECGRASFWLFEVESDDSDRHCERSEAIHGSASREMDCFAEPVIGRAFARPAGSQ